MSNTSLSTLVDDTLEAFEAFDLLRRKSPDATPLMSHEAIIAALAEPDSKQISRIVEVDAEKEMPTATQVAEKSNKHYVFTRTSSLWSSTEVKTTGSEAMSPFTSLFISHNELREERSASPSPSTNLSPHPSADSDSGSEYEKTVLAGINKLDILFEEAMINHANSHPPLEEFGVPCAEAEAPIREELPQARHRMIDDLQFYTNYRGEDTAPAYRSRPSSRASSGTTSWLNESYAYYTPIRESAPGPGGTQGDGPASTEVFKVDNDLETRFLEADPFRYVGPEDEGTAGPLVLNYASKAWESFYAEDPNRNRMEDNAVFNAYTAEQLTFFGGFLRAPFAPANPLTTSDTGHGSVSLGHEISPLDTESHVTCDCQRCYLMKVALTKEFGDPHPMEPWLAGFGAGDPIEDDSDLYTQALKEIRNS